MDVNAVGLPTNRPQLEQTSASTRPPDDVPGAKNYDGTASDLDKVNTAKAALPDGVGTQVDKTA